MSVCVIVPSAVNYSVMWRAVFRQRTVQAALAAGDLCICVSFLHLCLCSTLFYVTTRTGTLHILSHQAKLLVLRDSHCIFFCTLCVLVCVCVSVCSRALLSREKISRPTAGMNPPTIPHPEQRQNSGPYLSESLL